MSTAQIDVGLFEQFRGHAQVSLRPIQSGMTQISRESRKQALDIRTLSVPFAQAVNCKRVAQIMKPRLEV